MLQVPLQNGAASSSAAASGSAAATSAVQLSATHNVSAHSSFGAPPRGFIGGPDPILPVGAEDGHGEQRCGVRLCRHGPHLERRAEVHPWPLQKGMPVGITGHSSCLARLYRSPSLPLSSLPVCAQAMPTPPTLSSVKPAAPSKQRPFVASFPCLKSVVMFSHPCQYRSSDLVLRSLRSL